MKRILVVEDDTDLSMLLRLIMKIQQSDWELNSAKTGTDALTQVEKLQPDLILLDIMLPGMNGIEVCRRVQSETRWSRIKIVILSALSDLATQREALAAGALEYWTKPITPEELLNGIQRVLGAALPDIP
ncbi:MAG TPA: response regulator [Anaerolineae bacterium]